MVAENFPEDGSLYSRSESNQSELVFANDPSFDWLREEAVPESCKFGIHMPKLPIGTHPALEAYYL